jgi:Amt family ammonium transporter
MSRERLEFADSRRSWSKHWATAALLLGATATASAQDVVEAAAQVQTHANILWTLVAAILVFLMQAGFAFVESGFTRAKSAAHIMMKNLLDMSMGAMAYWLIGFGLMFGMSTGMMVGGDHFLFSADNGSADGQWEYTFWMFRVVFCATAATIVSGAMAERTKFSAYLIYGVVVSAVIYPVFGHWAWGNLLIGDNAGTWLADMGFNAGSTTTADSTIARIAVNTFLAACAGSISAMLISWKKFGKPDVGMTLNGVLAGLVGITAGCATSTPLGAIIIGVIVGIIVVYSVLFFDAVKIDDPVGAISVHGVCGTLAAALLHEELFISGSEYDLMGALTVQVIGIVTCFFWVFATSYILFKVLDATVGLRVSEQDELQGLDISEHGNSAYPDLVISGSAGM